MKKRAIISIDGVETNEDFRETLQVMVNDYKDMNGTHAKDISMTIEEEPKEVWIVTHESNLDGEVIFSVTPCETEEIAKKVFEKAKTKIMESPIYKGYEENKDDYHVVDANHHYFIRTSSDDYYEDIAFYKKEMVNE
jgi:hypothetical protein